jgi:hypothetical protein
MARSLTFVFTGAACLALIACNQGPAAEADRESEAVEAMTNDLRNDAEKAARRDSAESAVRSGLIDGHRKADAEVSAPKADPARN